MDSASAQRVISDMDAHKIIWDDNLRAEANRALSGGGGGGGGVSTPDYAAIAREQMKMMQEANAPAVASLQASIPETQAKYASEQQRLQAEKQPLEQRYQNLLSEVSRQGGVLTGREQTATSREFGRRGISLQSGIFDQTLNERLKPITEWQTGQTSSLGLERENALRDLQNLISKTSEGGIGAVREIQNAIAQLQAGGNQSAIQSALGIYNAQQQAAQRAQELALQERLASAKVDTNPLEQMLTAAQIAKLQAETARIARLGSGGGGSGSSEFE